MGLVVACWQDGHAMRVTRRYAESARRIRAQDDLDPGERVPPRGLGWFFAVGSPLFALAIAVWSWDEGLASILLNSWYMLVTFGFGLAILRRSRVTSEAQSP